MLMDVSHADSVEELVEKTESDVAGTPFEGELVPIMEEHRDVQEFLVQASDEFLPDAFLGEPSDVLSQGEELFDVEGFTEAVEESDAVMLLDFFKYDLECYSLMLEVVEEETESWDDVCELLSSVSGISAEEIDESARENRAEMVSEMREKIQESDGDEELKEELNEFVDELEEQDLREMFIEGLNLVLTGLSSQVSRHEYDDGEKPSVGEYFTYTTQVGEKQLEEIDMSEYDFSEETEFTVIGKITGSRVVETDIGEKEEFEYDVVSYDSVLKEVWPILWVFGDDDVSGADGTLDPSGVSQVEFYDGNPIGEVEVRKTP